MMAGVAGVPLDSHDVAEVNRPIMVARITGRPLGRHFFCLEKQKRLEASSSKHFLRSRKISVLFEVEGLWRCDFYSKCLVDLR